MRYERYVWAVILVLAGCAPGQAPVAPAATFPIKFGTFTAPRQHGVTDLFVYSPWEPRQYAQLSLPEHCWGVNLPNTSHDSDTLAVSPWNISPDSTQARYERQPRAGVLFRARAETDSMAVRLAIEIENHSALPVADIRALVCFKPDMTIGNPSRADAMSAFRDTSYALTWFPAGDRKIQLNEQTTFHGDYPPGIDQANLRYKIVWGINILDQPDIRSILDVGWWYVDNHPGRVVEEKADPALIAVHARQDSTRWIGIIWDPPRVLFCNPLNPCFHSDPAFPDCPPGKSTGARGIILFHTGTFEGLVQRARAWKATLQQ